MNKDTESFEVQRQDWEGFYLGANLGFATKSDDIDIQATNNATALTQSLYNTPPTALNVTDSGFLAGGGVGYNTLMHTLLFGLEGDLDYTAMGGANAVTPNEVDVVTSVSKHIHWLGTLRGRLGKLASEEMLIYATAGLGVGRTELTFDQRDPGFPCSNNLACNSGQMGQTQFGWVAGTGIEYLMSKRMRLKAEYLYVDLGSSAFSSTGNSILGPISNTVSTNFSNNLLRLGINVRV